MPRLPRIDVPRIVYHVISRGNRRAPLFHDAQDRQIFFNFLSLVRQDFPFELYAYSLMTNHFHFLLKPIDSSLSRMMQSFKSMYATWFNQKYDHVGHVFQGRFHSIPVQEDAYFMTVARYIDLNAVRAGIVKRPEDYAWGSYGNIIRGMAHPLVSDSFLLDYFGPDAALQRTRYQEFVNDMLTKEERITEKTLFRMRFWGDSTTIFRPKT